MQQVGRLAVADAYDCDAAAMNDAAGLEDLLRRAAGAAGAQVLHLHVHRFEPQGLTGMAIVSASHLGVHTWPECGYAAIDVFTCGQNDPWRAVETLVSGLGARRARVRELARAGGAAGAGARDLRRLTRFYRISDGPSSD